ncbi:hypothetical protein [Flavobacterium sp. 3HN19-14]|uniref:hypothetical protein n=1 Tax=Flavobacterium sp. 3HN19-14 TaxID=3448133 RepID=UPI003EDFFC54
MTGILAQLVALTTYGNDYLKNGDNAAKLGFENSVFQFCNSVDFRVFRKKFFWSKPQEEILVSNPAKWFEFLKHNGCKHLRLFFEYSKDEKIATDHKLAGMVGGGGTWLIEAVYETYSNFWANRWEVTTRDSPENKIWTVNYGMIFEKAETINLQPENLSVKEKFNDTLTEIAAFANAHQLKNWADLFERAKLVLSSDKPEENYYHDDFVPLQNYPLLSQQLLFAAGTAWVFGGMGSWNDIGFSNEEDDALYESLSAQLYANINEAIIAAVNAY